MKFFSSSFGKQPLGTNGRRGTDCLVLEYSELIVVGQIILQLALHVDSPWGGTLSAFCGNVPLGH